MRTSLIAMTTALLLPVSVWHAAADTPDATSDEDVSDAADSLLPGYAAEALLPEGFPPPGPAEAVGLKAYPAYRVAVSEGAGAFWRLFGHIQRANVPMTAPVTMTRAGEADDDGQGDMTESAVMSRDDLTMGFLYPAADVGEAGLDAADAGVIVRDVPAMTVLSYGFFGPPIEARLAEARAAIEAALPEKHADLAFSGPWRLLGYNGPMVPADRRYHEVQRPVTPKPTETTEDSAPTP